MLQLESIIVITAVALDMISGFVIYLLLRRFVHDLQAESRIKQRLEDQNWHRRFEQ